MMDLDAMPVARKDVGALGQSSSPTQGLYHIAIIMNFL
jgi:hypothetical protein